MGNPQVPAGTLNRLRGSLVFPDFPDFNITAAFLGKEAITFTPEGETTAYLETLVAAVTSQAPMQLVTISVALVKSQTLADKFKQKVDTDSSLGSQAIFRSDARPLSPYVVYNVSIGNVAPIKSDGTDPNFGLTIKGYRNINEGLWG